MIGKFYDLIFVEENSFTIHVVLMYMLVQIICITKCRITDLYFCQVDEYQGGRSLEELQGYMDTQLAVINVNADRTDEKIPEKVQVEEEKPQENLVLSYWLIF